MEYVSILSSILTPQCALERDHEQALALRVRHFFLHLNQPLQ